MEPVGWQVGGCGGAALGRVFPWGFASPVTVLRRCAAREGRRALGLEL